MLPYFYQEQLQAKEGNFTLDEAASRHCVQVLRMLAGAALLLTNGKGLLCHAVIIEASRKRTVVDIKSMETKPVPAARFGLAIAFTKNNSRNEWLLEKATELGISDIYPIQTQRSEKDKLRQDRLHTILVSAMLQSQQVHLPILHESQKLNQLFAATEIYTQKFIAHCEEDQERQSYWQELKTGVNTIVLIGPEGDFTKDEIDQSKTAGYQAVSFGTNRLRTETAGLYACTVFNAKNYG